MVNLWIRSRNKVVKLTPVSSVSLILSNGRRYLVGYQIMFSHHLPLPSFTVLTHPSSVRPCAYNDPLVQTNILATPLFKHTLTRPRCLMPNCQDSSNSLYSCANTWAIPRMPRRTTENASQLATVSTPRSRQHPVCSGDGDYKYHNFISLSNARPMLSIFVWWIWVCITVSI